MIINPVKTKTFLPKVYLYYPKFEPKATKWGISNEPVARANYIKHMKSLHKKFSVIEPRFYIDLEYPFMGASPNGLVHCECLGTGVLEIKCPWPTRNLQ